MINITIMTIKTSLLRQQAESLDQNISEEETLAVIQKVATLKTAGLDGLRWKFFTGNVQSGPQSLPTS